MDQARIYATGRRKNASARVYLSEGPGKVIINRMDMKEYLGGRETLSMMVHQPFELTETLGKFDVLVNVEGGGASGQAGAIRHGISKALSTLDAKYKAVLKKAGLLTRDPRKKERKKPGQPKARKKSQYSKR
ncbi:MAG: 30S ribosomal protein S9 [Nitrospirae bacterium CG_4_9_14_3_um_filter_53_35]|nr:MAG: 30S ribosomal protein S9 [Nitrospirae bacterium CG2_30_53_67]PIS36458.1 MAG: 30S ribosomal protein S9 [Nitrospirae bacterium CG08_land_8_20_14_0_20_52_24]PIV84798.1 MAG: 30S ribosomal protein S9 [Nitrospirae bacterium CG17_big_fil_post_rev_8_21_14_2_50_50_9]PIW85161.1 MAG: 30S ribosomal protein S9 [Nitrospirae bacterium CG_4_8_14_3_um_filter_50_41]PIX85942.1 MAG: 30S ribosomal protein S9 [Nitrospirae bacterium CG_4_10_14_3_um_filter_53_41]PJA73626.1 MAG: 30S ribosomal protein S9 [Nitro